MPSFGARPNQAKRILESVHSTASLPAPKPESHLQSAAMGSDEQREERDVLDSIFADEITGTSLA